MRRRDRQQVGRVQRVLVREHQVEARRQREIARALRQGPPPLSAEEAAHIALLEAVAAGQAEQESAASGVADVGSEGAVAKCSPSEATSAPSEAPAEQGPGIAAGNGRDPRLGNYLSLGAFLTHCFKRLGMSRNQVMDVAGLPHRRSATELLDYPGGLPALYAACEARKKGRAA